MVFQRKIRNLAERFVQQRTRDVALAWRPLRALCFLHGSHHFLEREVVCCIEGDPLCEEPPKMKAQRSNGNASSMFGNRHVCDLRRRPELSMLSSALLPTVFFLTSLSSPRGYRSCGGTFKQILHPFPVYPRWSANLHGQARLYFKEPAYLAHPVDQSTSAQNLHIPLNWGFVSSYVKASALCSE